MESREERLNKARERLAKQKPPKKPGPIKRIARIAGHETHAFLHGKVYQEERDNVGVEGGHFVEHSGEAALHYGRHKVRRAIREHPAKAAARAESRYIKATADYHSRKFAQEQPEAQSAAARLWHRHKLKREYQRKARETAKQTAKAAEQTVSATEWFVREAAAFVKRHPVGTLLALGCLLVVLTLQSCMSSMVSVGNSTLAAIAASTYKAEDADMLGAEAAYCALEDELQRYLDTYTRTHDYDEYHFDLDTIEHDPYVLISMISALHEGAWTLDEVQGTLQDLFDRQYILTEDVVVEVRYRTVTRTDSEGNDYEVDVPYNYYICYVTLENFNLSHVPVYMMSEEQLSMYALYMSTLGNRPDLFPTSGYIGKYITNRPPEHEVPESYLDDETFAAILKEAEKYLGFPMCGAAAARPRPLTAPASSAMSTINAAGASGGWGRRAFITSAPGRAAPAPVIWCSLSAPMTQRVFLMWASMWATAGCFIVATPSAMPTSTRVTGSPISTPTENCFDRRFFMAISKSAKIQAEIEKVTAKINEQQARLKELEQKKLEAENSEIVEIVRGMNVSLTDLPVLLQTIKNGGTLGQNVPKSDPTDKEDSE